MDWQSNGDRVGTRCADYRLFRLDNAGEVSSGFADMVLKATRQGVKFVHHDIFFLVIDENYQGRAICGDLGQVKPHSGEASSALRNHNWWAGRVFLSELNKHLDPLQFDLRFFDSRVKGAVL